MSHEYRIIDPESVSGRSEQTEREQQFLHDLAVEKRVMTAHAKRLINLGVDDDIIRQAIGLSPEYIETLRAEIHQQ